LAGSSDKPYIDWDGHSWYTQFFYDKSLGAKFSFFADAGVLTESMFVDGTDMRVSTPVSAILSYYPVDGVTTYLMASGSAGSSLWGQSGLGAKYLINPLIELEALYSVFTNEFLLDVDGGAQTFNIGLRISL